MICMKYAHKFCRDDISKIENYDLAIADTTQTWHCHHRDEIRTLPSGMKVYRSKQELIENGRYFNCPANELIFLTSFEHRSTHHKGMTSPMKGKITSPEVRHKLSLSLKGKKRSAETRLKMSETKKAYWASHKVVPK